MARVVGLVFHGVCHLNGVVCRAHQGGVLRVQVVGHKDQRLIVLLRPVHQAQQCRGLGLGDVAAQLAVDVPLHPPAHTGAGIQRGGVHTLPALHGPAARGLAGGGAESGGQRLAHPQPADAAARGAGHIHAHGAGGGAGRKGVQGNEAAYIQRLGSAPGGAVVAELHRGGGTRGQAVAGQGQHADGRGRAKVHLSAGGGTGPAPGAGGGVFDVAGGVGLVHGKAVRICRHKAGGGAWLKRGREAIGQGGNAGGGDVAGQAPRAGILAPAVLARLYSKGELVAQCVGDAAQLQLQRYAFFDVRGHGAAVGGHHVVGQGPGHAGGHAPGLLVGAIHPAGEPCGASAHGLQKGGVTHAVGALGVYLLKAEGEGIANL